MGMWETLEAVVKILHALIRAAALEHKGFLRKECFTVHPVHHQNAELLS